MDLGDGSWHSSPYHTNAHPYNYRDMTGFNVRVVNPSLKPLKGYWMVLNDSGQAGQLWNKVSWNATNAVVTNGCSIEVYVRASDYRTGLGSEVFVPVTNNASFAAIRGRYIEVRLAMTRDDPSKQPVVYDLTLYGVSSGFVGDDFLYGAWADEGGDGVFWTDLVGAEPVGYRWFRQWPWETNMSEVVGETNSYLAITNVDSWVEGTMAMCFVTNGAGESLWLGPASLTMDPADIRIPPTNYSNNLGPATRYPMTIRVFGMSTNFNNVSVTVTLWGLSHERSADMNILAVSPLGKQVMLMSNTGGTNGADGAILAFNQAGFQMPQPARIPSGGPQSVQPNNYGSVSQMPQVATDPPPTHSGTYSANLLDLQYDDPNGPWKLYIYDTVSGKKGHLDGSWRLDFDFY